MDKEIYIVTFFPQNITCKISNKQSILEASYMADISINAACSGLGTCGLCKIKILKGTYKTKDSQFISSKEKKNNIVLACLTYATSNLEVEVIYREEKGKFVSLIKDSTQIKNIIPPLPTDVGKENYGISIDIGTTTISLNLLDLKNGTIVDEASDYNGQIKFGQDIIHRIMYGEKEEGLNHLKNAIRDTINQLVDKLINRHNISEDFLRNYAICGNTTMIYLLLGLDPSKIRVVPPVPLGLSFPLHHIQYLGFRGYPKGKVFICPGVANYLGGDIVSGITSIGLHNTKELTLFLDIGTNGEIILGNKDWLMGCACSAGPSFEGMGIKCGIRAMEGAIENISVNQDLSNNYSVIGGVKPKGLCGTALIDLMADLYSHKIINGKGKFADTPITKEKDGIRSYYINDNIFIDEIDLDNLIRTKAAIYAGITTLIKKIGIKLKDIHKVVIGGGFGHYLNIEKCLTVGMFPEIPKEKFLFFGNTSLAGARLLLLSADKREEAEELSKKITYIDLSTENMFMDEFTAAMFIPHTNR